MTEFLRRYRKVITALIVVAAACGALWLYDGGILFLLPSYSQQNLLGLTPDQVIQRLGSPDDDPRTRGWKDEDGPLLFSYSWNWAHAIIEFRQGRVTRVDRGWK